MENRILLATNNEGKISELRDMLIGSPIIVASRADFPEVDEVEETALTFAENARLKASGYARQTGLVALADDSGLEVAALGGRPGVLSARYGGEGKSFDQKMRMLLGELAQIDGGDRQARFVSSIAISDVEGNILIESRGVCNGRITTEPRGLEGFGYDPLFIPDGYENTFGELPSAVKAKISHRAAAFREIIPFLRDYMAD
ncbi:MAG: RdgB/HAM1 family non-canonical purine NTP pyrophosphatase [Pyrinomonadaceae bacterium]